MKIDEENGSRVENIILKKDFKSSLIQWRHKKKIDKFLERLHNRIIENNVER